MSIKDLLLRKMLQSKMKGIPVEEQEKVFSMMQKNPELFQKIAVETKQAMDTGKDQMAAVKTVMEKYKDQLSDLNK
jgi:hypothetical protein